jgi:thiol:disulfide interchange protein
LVADALAIAKKDDKRVLLQFGSHGCTWCHVLQKLFETDQNIVTELKSDYVYVMIDITRGRNKGIDGRYGNPTRNGVPVIVILDADGKQLVTKGGGIVEGDPLRPSETYHISPVTMLNFLKNWAPNR